MKEGTGQGRKGNVTLNIFGLQANTKHEEMLAVGLAAVRKQYWP